MIQHNARDLFNQLIRDRTCTATIAPQDLQLLKRKLSGLKHRMTKQYPELALQQERLYYSTQASSTYHGALEVTITLRDPLDITSRSTTNEATA